jgi:hypothetical protein
MALGTKNYLGDKYDEFLSNEKRALLAMTAEHGTQAQAVYDQTQKAAKDARSQSLEAAAARGAAIHAPEALQAELSQNYNTLLGAYSDPAVSSSMIHGREMDRIGAANAAYIEAMRAQAPLLKSQLDAQLEALRLQAEADKAARRGGGGGGGRGGGGGGGAFPGLLGDDPMKMDPEDPNKVANELAEYALRLPQAGVASRQEARAEAMGMLDEALTYGAITRAQYDNIKRQLLMSFAAVDSGRAVYSSAQLGRNTTAPPAPAWRTASLAGMMPQNVRTGHGASAKTRPTRRSQGTQPTVSRTSQGTQPKVSRTPVKNPTAAKSKTPVSYGSAAKRKTK